MDSFTMPLVQLIPNTVADALAQLDAMPPDQSAQVSPHWISRLQSPDGADPWILGFRIAERSTGEVIGGCGFKGPPDAEGMVEIAYGIYPEHHGKGFATEAARALIDHARDSGAVRLIRAHTLPENGASQRVLTKCGFACVGEVIDPEDGLVWRWERCC